MKAVRFHIGENWVLLYIRRWLEAPMIRDGEEIPRSKGTPQGGVVSPIASNLFLHYAFDKWMTETHPQAPFVRYADDGVIHCRTKKEALHIKKALEKRFKEVGLEIDPTKTKIVRCKDSNRPTKKGEKVSFDFLGYTFKPRGAESKEGKRFISFLPAVSGKAKKAINKTVRDWGIRKKSHVSIQDQAKTYNKAIKGWMNYYGKFYPSELYTVLRRINYALKQWARRTLKRLKGSFRLVNKWLKNFVKTNPRLFVHWQLAPP